MLKAALLIYCLVYGALVESRKLAVDDSPDVPNVRPGQQRGARSELRALATLLGAVEPVAAFSPGLQSLPRARVAADSRNWHTVMEEGKPSESTVVQPATPEQLEERQRRRDKIKKANQKALERELAEDLLKKKRAEAEASGEVKETRSRQEIAQTLAEKASEWTDKEDEGFLARLKRDPLRVIIFTLFTVLEFPLYATLITFPFWSKLVDTSSVGPPPNT